MQICSDHVFFYPLKKNLFYLNSSSDYMEEPFGLRLWTSVCAHYFVFDVDFVFIGLLYRENLE